MFQSNFTQAVRDLLKFEPFARFYLVAGDQEWFIENPKMLWIPDDCDFAVFGKEGTSDIINLSVVTHVRIDDDFGLGEAKRIWK